nr:unnamed protein product [Callosobruchus analis]
MLLLDSLEQAMIVLFLITGM